MNKIVMSLLLLGLVTPAYSAAPNEISDGRSSISVEQLQNELLVLAPQFRGTVSSDAKNVARFAETVLMNERVAEKARELGYAKLPEVQADINKTVRDILANRYLRDQLEERRRTAPNFELLAREDYEVNKSTYLKPEAFRASHILLRVDPEDARISDEVAVKARAQSLLEQIRNGADFEEMAKQHSEERLAPKNGGDLGWVDIGRTVPPFETAAMALNPGEVSDLVRTRFGFHIIKVHEKRPSYYLPFDEVKEQIIKKLMDRYMSERRTEILSQFEGLREIIISPEVMKQIQSGQ